MSGFSSSVSIAALKPVFPRSVYCKQQNLCFQPVFSSACCSSHEKERILGRRFWCKLSTLRSFCYRCNLATDVVKSCGHKLDFCAESENLSVISEGRCYQNSIWTQKNSQINSGNWNYLKCLKIFKGLQGG
jgi:hypothetical protein